MPSTGDAPGKAAQRARIKNRVFEIAAAGGPMPPATMRSAPALGWYADHLEPRTFEEVYDEIEYVGEIEGLIASASTAADGGMTMQVQVLPAYVHTAVDMVQRSTQGVLVAVLFQAPWELFKRDGDPVWDHLAEPGTETGED